MQIVFFLENLKKIFIDFRYLGKKYCNVCVVMFSIRLKDYLYIVFNIKDVYDLECKNNGQKKVRMFWRR